ncbi:MAG: aspartyl protease family protein [Bacteroidales bacterium]|nr:aspartyl protease family protein [Bacteroidales bacterium]
MKRILTAISILLLSSSVIFAQEADMKVGELLNTGNWFDLERIYPAVAADMQTPMLKQMAEVMLASNFNRPAEMREKFQKLIAEHQAELGFENVCNMTVMGAMVEGYEGNYAVAADMVKAIAEAVKAATGSLEGTGLSELLAYYEAVRGYPAPVLEKPAEDIKIALTEKSDLLWIPVVVNGKTYDFILDTGASFTMISQDLAKDMGAKIIGDPVFVGGGESTGGYGQRTFIENMNVGPVSLKNIIAFVSENPSDDDPLKVDAVLGMDFIERAGEIQIDLAAMTLTIPAQTTVMPASGRNIILETNIPVVESTDSNGNRYTFILDTGASGANLSDLWFAKNAEMAAALPVETQNVWGHGGTVQLHIVKIPEYKLTIGTASAEFKDLPVTVPANGTVSSSRDGRLGMGLLKQFSKVIFNFEDMFVAFE